MVRITSQRVHRVQLTALKLFHIQLSEAESKQVIRWDTDGSFVDELCETGELDTAPRDYFGMAVLEAILPGPPSVQDDLIGDIQDHWHWPCFGSSPEYVAAFQQAWQACLEQRRSR